MNRVILIDGVDKTSDVISVTIQVADSDYVNTVELAMEGAELYEALVPNLTGEERIEVQIDDISYFFMLEEKSQSIEFGSNAFTIWGRSRVAKLDKPYVLPFISPEFASPAFASTLIERYSRNDVVFQSLEGVSLYDFMVPADTLSIAGQTAISIIQELATAMGGIVRSMPDGMLCIRPARPHPDMLSLAHGILSHDSIKSITKENKLSDRGLPEAVDNTIGDAVMAAGVDTWSRNTVLVEVSGGDPAAEERSFTLELDKDSHPDGVPESGNVFLAFSQSSRPSIPYHLRSTAGVCTFRGTASTERTDLLSITNIENVNLQFPALSITSAVPQGHFPGTLSLTTPGQSQCTITPNAGWETSFFGLIEVTYQSPYDKWELVRSANEKILVVAISDETSRSTPSNVAIQRGSGDERIVETISNPLITTQAHAEAIGQLRAVQTLWNSITMKIEHFWLNGLHDGDVLDIEGQLWVITGYTVKIDSTGIMTTTDLEGDYV